MFLLKLSTLSAAIFLFVSLVLSLLCVYYIRMLCRHVCFVSNNVVADECDHALLVKAALCMDTLCIQQIPPSQGTSFKKNTCASLDLQRSGYGYFNACFTQITSSKIERSFGLD